LAVTASPTATIFWGFGAQAYLVVTATTAGSCTRNHFTGAFTIPITATTSAAGIGSGQLSTFTTGTASLTADVGRGQPFAAALTATATPTATPSKGQSLAASLPVTAAVSSSGTRNQFINASLAVTATPAALANTRTSFSAALPVTASRTAALTRGQSLNAALVVTSSLPVSMGVAYAVSANTLAVTGTFLCGVTLARMINANQSINCSVPEMRLKLDASVIAVLVVTETSDPTNITELRPGNFFAYYL
jgi:hypothetical protein